MTASLIALGCLLVMVGLIYLGEIGLRRPAKAEAQDHEIESAIRLAFAHVGLNVESCRRDYNVAATGKLNEIILHAAGSLNKDHPITTVQDIIDLLKVG